MILNINTQTIGNIPIFKIYSSFLNILNFFDAKMHRIITSIQAYSIMINRTKKLNLNTPYKKISEALWEQKRINATKQKENVQMHTRLLQFNQSKTINKPSQFSNPSKLEEKYQKCLVKVRQQIKWIKQTTDLFQERNYEELKVQVGRLQKHIKNETKAAINFESKMKKYIEKITRVKELRERADIQSSEQIFNHPFSELERQREQLGSSIKNHRIKLQMVQKQGRQLNSELIGLLSIKNQLKTDAKQLKDFKQCRYSACKTILRLQEKNCENDIQN